MDPVVCCPMKRRCDHAQLESQDGCKYGSILLKLRDCHLCRMFTCSNLSCLIFHIGLKIKSWRAKKIQESRIYKSHVFWQEIHTFLSRADPIMGCSQTTLQLLSWKRSKTLVSCYGSDRATNYCCFIVTWNIWCRKKPETQHTSRERMTWPETYQLLALWTGSTYFEISFSKFWPPAPEKNST